MSITITLPDELERTLRARAAIDNKSLEIVFLEALIRGLGLKLSDFDLNQIRVIID